MNFIQSQLCAPLAVIIYFLLTILFLQNFVKRRMLLLEFLHGVSGGSFRHCFLIHTPNNGHFLRYVCHLRTELSATAIHIGAKVRYTVHFIEKSTCETTAARHAMQNTETQKECFYLNFLPDTPGKIRKLEVNRYLETERR